MMQLEAFDDDNVPGKAYIHLLAGGILNRHVIESFGSLCIVYGRLKLRSNDGSKEKIIPYEYAIDSAESIAIKTETVEFPSDKIPNWIKPTTYIQIKSSGFPADCVLESIVMDLVQGDFVDVDDIDHLRRRTSVFYSQPHLKFKSYDTIRVIDQHPGYSVVEILFDKMTLFTATIATPKADGLRIDIGSGLPFPAVTRRRARLWTRMKRMFLELNVSVEIFTYFILMLGWFVHCSAHDNYDYFFSSATLFFATVALLFVIVFRRLVRFCFGSWLYVPMEFNGRSFFVNGWQSWSFTGSILHGQKPPLYSMPALFVESFHHGGLGTALPINQGKGKVPFRLGCHSFSTSNTTSASNDQTAAEKKDDKKTSQRLGHEIVDEEANRDYIASDMFTLLSDLQSKTGVFMGFISQQEHFGCIATNIAYDRLTAHVSGDGVVIPAVTSRFITTDPLIMYTVSSLDNPFSVYSSIVNKVHAVETLMQSNVAKTVPAGWCSWYHFYEKISEDILLKNMQGMVKIDEERRLDKVGFNLFQIDDGYQLHWGDWTQIAPHYSFSKSLSATVTKLSEDGFRTGLWLAPFAADHGAEISKKHPNWILRQTKENISKHWLSRILPNLYSVCNSANCGKFFYGLDTTLPEFQVHLREVIRVATRVWGFNYLKLDFLYAAVLHQAQSECHHDKFLTKAQMMRRALQLIRDEAGDNVFILGCGAPLGSLLGIFHANRVSADMGLSWDPEFPLPKKDAWNLPCARNAVRNTLTRSFMHRKWFINDPDCMLLRDGLKYTEEEVIALATVRALSGGSMIISDDLSSISNKRMLILTKMLPPSDIPCVAVDLCYCDTPELLRVVFTSSQTATNRQSSQASMGEYDSALTPSQDEYGRHGMSNMAWDMSVVTPTDRLTNSISSKKAKDDGINLNANQSDSESIFSDMDLDPSPASPIRLNPSLRPRRFSNNDLHTEVNEKIALLAPDDAEDDGEDEEVVSPQVDTHMPSKTEDNNSQKKQKWRDEQRQRKAHLLDKRDLLRRWYLFAACNWSDPPTPSYFTTNHANKGEKTHFVHVRDIFGEHDVEEFIAYTRFLYRKELQRRDVELYEREQEKTSFSLKRASFDMHDHSNNYSPENMILNERSVDQKPSLNLRSMLTMPGAGSSSLSSLNLLLTPADKLKKKKKLGINHVLHLFNFWEEKYSHKVITLDDEEGGEIAFDHIPAHGVKLFAIRLSLHPLMPVYLGSNMHFSCGQEIYHAGLVETPIEMLRSLRFLAAGIAPVKKRSKTNVHAAEGPHHHSQQQKVEYQVSSLAIEFKDGMLKEEGKLGWHGAIWLFLPINIHRARQFGHVLGKLQVKGERGLVVSEQKVEVLEYLEETSCTTAGYTVKISVGKERGLDEIERKQKTHPVQEKVGLLTVAWISDVLDVSEKCEGGTKEL